MPFIISNPWGFLTLLGIPAILLIHFLQRRAKVIPCSTLFLLKQTQRESVSGRKFDNIINSIPLWMQLLAVLLATLILIQPRYINSQSTQRIAIVLDSSASMAVFKTEAKNKILEQIPIVQKYAPKLELWLLDSDLSRDRIYHGDSIEELEKAIDQWVPQSGTSNPHHTLRVARSLAGHEGALLYITDTPVRSIPFNTAVHAVGEARANVGFTGIAFETKSGELFWKASVRNYSRQPAIRTWQVHIDRGEATEPRELGLAAGELKVLTGPFPKNSERILVSLSPDDFTLDNTLPLIAPVPKVLEVYSQCSEALKPFTQKIITGFESLKVQDNPEISDLNLFSSDSETNSFGRKPAIVFLDPKEAPEEYLAETIVASQHPLTEGLKWTSLRVSKEKRFSQTKWDTPLLWCGENPIIMLREVPVGLGDTNKQLLFNFNIPSSNAANQEAIALLIYRFIDRQRKDKKSLIRAITEINQPLELTTDKKGREVVIENTELQGTLISSKKWDPKHPISTSSNVGFYSVRQGDQYLLHASNYFADTREADLSKCATADLNINLNSKAIDKQSEEDKNWRLWILLILAALLFSWFYGKNPHPN